MTSYKQSETDSAPARLEDVLDKLIQAERAMVWTRAINAMRADYEEGMPEVSRYREGLTMKQPDLKPCPFCGAPAVLKTYHQPIEHGPGDMLRIECSGCWVKTRAEDTCPFVPKRGHVDATQEAIDALAETWCAGYEPV